MNASLSVTAMRVALPATFVIFAIGWPAAMRAQTTDAASASLAPYHMVRDGIPEPVAGARGDAERGRKLIVAREAANCALCHAISDAALRVAGNVGPPLDGVAAKFSVAQLRLRVADYLQVDATAIMPSYYRIEGFNGVASAYRGKPILTAGQVEDIVAYLATLK